MNASYKMMNSDTTLLVTWTPNEILLRKGAMNFNHFKVILVNKNAAFKMLHCKKTDKV